MPDGDRHRNGDSWQPRITRRQALQIGGLCALGAGIAGDVHAERLAHLAVVVVEGTAGGRVDDAVGGEHRRHRHGRGQRLRDDHVVVVGAVLVVVRLGQRVARAEDHLARGVDLGADQVQLRRQIGEAVSIVRPKRGQVEVGKEKQRLLWKPKANMARRVARRVDHLGHDATKVETVSVSQQAPRRTGRHSVFAYA